MHLVKAALQLCDQASNSRQCCVCELNACVNFFFFYGGSTVPRLDLCLLGNWLGQNFLVNVRKLFVLASEQWPKIEMSRPWMKKRSPVSSIWLNGPSKFLAGKTKFCLVFCELKIITVGTDCPASNIVLRECWWLESKCTHLILPQPGQTICIVWKKIASWSLGPCAPRSKLLLLFSARTECSEIVSESNFLDRDPTSNKHCKFLVKFRAEATSVSDP